MDRYESDLHNVGTRANPHKCVDEQLDPNCGTFGWALKQLRQGKKIFRRDWNGKGMHLGLHFPDANSKMSRPYLYIKTAQNDLVPWVASHGDLLNDDWQVVRE